MPNKKILLIGDFKSNTGPAIANRSLRKALGNDALYSNANTLIGRFLELFVKIPFSASVCFCGFSVLDMYGVKLCKIFRKRAIYLMHGDVEIEAKINHVVVSAKRLKAHKYVIEKTDLVICVSKLLADEVKKNFREQKNVSVVYDIVEPLRNTDVVKRDSFQIMSTGGGVLQKNNLMVCKAIAKINDLLPVDKRYKYKIVGKCCGGIQDFKKYDFVEFLGEISHEETLRLMRESSLYVQNSVFETFGMAIIEAIACGCQVVVSNRIGALEIIDGLREENIIYDCMDIDEIKNKILTVMLDKRNIDVAVDWKKISNECVAKKFLAITGKMA